MTDTTKKTTIEPLEGWTVQTPYGTLKTRSGVLLVRLEDIHAWLMKKKGIPSASASVQIFGVFASDGNSEHGMKHGAAKVRSGLYITDLSDYAEPFSGFYEGKNLEKITEQIPYVPHHHFDRGTVTAVFYSLGVVAGEVWAPHMQNADVNDRLDDYCAEGYFPSIERCREILNHLAVPIGLAHALWDWGRVVEVAGGVAKVTPLHSVPKPDSKRDPLTAELIKNGVGKNKRGEWLPEAKELFKKAYRDTNESGEKLEDVAATFGLTRQAFSAVATRIAKGTRSKKVAKPAQPLPKQSATR